MSIRLVVEVFDHAPAELTASERLVLLVLAESARDETRTCWPTMELLVKRTGLGSDRSVRKALVRLAERGYEVRVPTGTDRRGRPTFAHTGHATVYRIPALQRGPHRAALMGEPQGPLQELKEASQGRKRRPHRAAKEAPQGPPPLNEPSKEPSNPRDRRANADLNTIRAALVKVGCKRLDDDWCRQVVKHAEQNGTVRKDLTGFVVACIEREPERFTPVADYAPRYRKEDH